MAEQVCKCDCHNDGEPWCDSCFNKNHVTEPSPEPEAAPSEGKNELPHHRWKTIRHASEAAQPQQASAGASRVPDELWNKYRIVQLEAQLAALKTCLGECRDALKRSLNAHHIANDISRSFHNLPPQETPTNYAAGTWMEQACAALANAKAILEGK